MQLKKDLLLDLIKSTRTHSEERIKALEINLHKYKQANTKPPVHILERIKSYEEKVLELNHLESEIKESSKVAWKI
ncbi:hypothetical protein HCJ02_01920 [Listeria seeligeri]|uniref:Uncharacterized protein n=1 Tax=Listeria immobilis TaxID=2713502 RepID=A0ABR6SVA4_9LIST|nr:MULTISPECIES: hypothetical protein [Listeria]MBC1509450.1 hypothetical protein [Listeria immobilis]MBC1532091.1 hypothetical protein [Listeria seeligeri]MBC1827095.1 hypothetical protein [Listeria seeligeri]MBC1840111.1 hypothetical protein [Listeria seeligeri]MBC6141882.1 hypothetical protein [Listeria seeligeri]